ncbi:MAG: hypothetical protein IPG53_11900 [Ignavibacteriales bacterium]|nr:hypothetical protein [Ignavibacteriales bacterium]
MVFFVVVQTNRERISLFRDLNSRGSKVIAAGDMNQSIYDNTCPEDDIIDYLDLDIHRLRIIHRLSRNARMLAAPFCEDKSGFMSASMGSGVELKPKLISGRSYEEELRWLSERAFGYAETGYHTAILLPSHQDIRYPQKSL